MARRQRTQPTAGMAENLAMSNRIDRSAPPPGFTDAIAGVLSGAGVLLDEMAHQTGDPRWSVIASELDRLVEQTQHLGAGRAPRVTQPLGFVH